MRALHHRLHGLRTQARLLRARTAWRHPGLVRPARLVLRLDPCGLPAWPTEAQALSLPELQDWIAEAVRWRGALPVSVLTERLAEDPRATEAARFAHRLECPTTIRATARPLPAEAALRVVDAGVQRMVLVLAGDLDSMQSAVASLDEARSGRKAPLALAVEVPWTTENAPLARAAAAWVRARGGVRFAVTAPASREGCGPEPSAAIGPVVAEAGAADATLPGLASALERFDAPDLPGAPRVSARCRVGGQRLELDGLGSLRCCPFKEALPASGDLVAAWAGASVHLKAVAQCDRTCSHPELQPFQEA